MAKQDTPKRKNGKEISLKVRVDLLDGHPPKDGLGVAVYAFTRGGQLIASARLGDDGIAVLPIPVPKEASAVNLVAGPVVDTRAPDLSDLLRRGARRQSARIDPDILNAEAAFEVLPNHWHCWFASRCYVPGKLVKRTELDGMKIDLPVCGAEIEVYEVDPIPLVIARLPEDIVDRFRRWMIEPDPQPWEIQLPEQKRFPLPGPKLGASMALMSEMDQPAVPTDPSFDAGPVGMAAVPSDLRLAAQTASLPQFRDALMRAPDLSRFLICRYFPGGVSKQLVATTTTDDCGEFRAVFFRGCANPDQPDLYFKAKRSFGPFTVSILAPTPVVCHTHWNYVCGSHVNLVTTHALAPTCPPCQPIQTPAGDWIAVMHIGNLPLSRIRGASPNQDIIDSTTTDNIGKVFINKTEAEAADTFDGRPMGGLLRPHLEFDGDSLRSKGIKYYQVSWREGTSGAFQPLLHEIHRHYSFKAPGSSEPTLVVYPLGPVSVGGKSLFKIPPNLPPSGIWSYPDLVENNTSAKFPSNVHVPPAKAGKFQLKIDLFDTSGNLVDIDAAATKTIFVVPEELDLSQPLNVHTRDADALSLIDDDNGDGLRSFILTLHVDNTTCEAAIEPAKLGTLAANSCGVLPYDSTNTGQNVSMLFKALHDNGQATYQFTLKRGVTGLGGLTIGGSNPLVDPRALLPGNFSQTATVNTLTMAYPALGLPKCDMAAFSEHVRVWAMATNGWRRLSEYDAYDHGAFVLAPQTNTP